jgi:predicted tellurium resistance membrane protein TerC
MLAAEAKAATESRTMAKVGACVGGGRAAEAGELMSTRLTAHPAKGKASWRRAALTYGGGMLEEILVLVRDPNAWAALVTLVVMEVVLGIDNLIFISILTNKLPEHQRSNARRIGIGLAVILRLGLLSGVAYIVQLTTPVFSLFGHSFSWRDLILIAGGLFLIYKATSEIHDHVTVDYDTEAAGRAVQATVVGVIGQILILDLVFSLDSIITAVGMTDDIPIMIAAVVIAVAMMLLAADPLAAFINRNPTIVMLALSFLLMIGMTLIADGVGVKVPKGYIYAAMAFSAVVEALNMLARRAQRKRRPLRQRPR